MPNEEHLKILQEGIAAWNKWRDEHPEIQPDLTEADLRCKILDDERLYDVSVRRSPWLTLIGSNGPARKKWGSVTGLHPRKGCELGDTFCWEIS